MNKLIKIGTKVKSTIFGEGTVVDIYNLEDPLMFYPYVIEFTLIQKEDYFLKKQVCFDSTGSSIYNSNDVTFYDWTN